MGRTAVDRTGCKYGRLTAVEPDPRRKGYWLCRCECGGETTVRSGNLTSGQVRSCGCLHREAITSDVSGERFGRLVAVERVGSAGGFSLWLCLCDCGREVTVRLVNLSSGNTKSCGCWKVDELRARATKHGMSGTLAYKRWESIKQRCTNPNNPAWKNYGGRGIVMADEWAESFDAFYSAVGDCPEGMELDRIDNDRGYEPGNVRWADHSAQMKNRRPMRRATMAEVEALKARIAELEAALSAVAGQ